MPATRGTNYIGTLVKVLLNVDGMDQWIVRGTVVPYVVQLLGSSPLQNIWSHKKPMYMIEFLID